MWSEWVGGWVCGHLCRGQRPIKVLDTVRQVRRVGYGPGALVQMRLSLDSQETAKRHRVGGVGVHRTFSRGLDWLPRANHPLGWGLTRTHRGKGGGSIPPSSPSQGPSEGSVLPTNLGTGAAENTSPETVLARRHCAEAHSNQHFH